MGKWCFGAKRGCSRDGDLRDDVHDKVAAILRFAMDHHRTVVSAASVVLVHRA